MFRLSNSRMGLGYRTGISLSALAGGVESLTDIVLLLGQSNQVGTNAADASSIDWPSNVYFLDPSDDSINLAPTTKTDPITFMEQTTGSTDFNAGRCHIARNFVNDYLIANPGRTVILLPLAAGGTSFTEVLSGNGEWDIEATGRLYAEAVRLIGVTKTAYPNANFLAALMQLGETDALGYNGSFRTQMALLIEDIRSVTGNANLPFLFGEMCPDSISAQDRVMEPWVDIAAQIRDFKNYIPFTYDARATDTATWDALTGDTLHFDLASERTVGQLQFDALAEAQANSSAALGNGLVGVRQFESAATSALFPRLNCVSGDTLVIMTASMGSTSTPVPSAITVEGISATSIVSVQNTVARKLGLTAWRITLASTPADNQLDIGITWSSNPVSFVVAVFRHEGAAAANGAGSFDTDFTLTGPSISLTDNLPGTVFAIAAIDDGAVEQSITFSSVTVVAGMESPFDDISSGGEFYSVAVEDVAGSSLSASFASGTSPAENAGMIAVAMVSAP